MIILNDSFVEVIDYETGVVRVVNVHFYERNKDRLIPTDEYFVKDPTSANVVINTKRVEEAKASKQEPAALKVGRQKKTQE